VPIEEEEEEEEEEKAEKEEKSYFTTCITYIRKIQNTALRTTNFKF
jgi:hypothetical protein